MKVKRFKLCMVGSYGVGKTSLTRRFVDGVFGENYQSTIGVGIDTLTHKLSNGGKVKLVIWDVAGGDDLTEINRGYLQGAHALLFVVDSARPSSFDAVRNIQSECQWSDLDVPYLILLNKSDLPSRVDQVAFDKAYWSSSCIDVLATSAKTGSNVELAFDRIVNHLVQPSDGS